MRSPHKWFLKCALKTHYVFPKSHASSIFLPRKNLSLPPTLALPLPHSNKNKGGHLLLSTPSLFNYSTMKLLLIQSLTVVLAAAGGAHAESAQLRGQGSKNGEDGKLL